MICCVFWSSSIKGFFFAETWKPRRSQVSQRKWANVWQTWYDSLHLLNPNQTSGWVYTNSIRAVKADVQQCHQEGAEPANSHFTLLEVFPSLQQFSSNRLIHQNSVPMLCVFIWDLRILGPFWLSISAGRIVGLSCSDWLTVIVSPPTSTISSSSLLAKHTSNPSNTFWI